MEEEKNLGGIRGGREIALGIGEKKFHVCIYSFHAENVCSVCTCIYSIFFSRVLMAADIKPQQYKASARLFRTVIFNVCVAAISLISAFLVGDAELRAMIAHFDSSKSGRLDIDDFGNAMGRSLSL